MKRFYIISGEASGDMHASDVVREIGQRLPSAEFRGWGGDLMSREGVTIVKHYRDLAFMGFTEVIKNLRTILKNISLCKSDIENYKPDAIILVDYPGFNLRIAEWAKTKGYKVYYYISPQVWAWKASRVKKIRRFVDKMFVILPFEKEFYNSFGYDVEYVGHPLPDVIRRKKNELPGKKDFLEKNNLPDKPIIAILPGSRKQEIETMLPLMLSVRDEFKDYTFVVAATPVHVPGFYKKLAGNIDVHFVTDATYELLVNSFAALVTSGTATLETALLNVPEVVCYKGGAVSYLIARSLVNIKFISLVNLIMNREVVKELIQSKLNTKNISVELNKILDDNYRVKIFSDYHSLQEKLNSGGAASKTAEFILKDIGEVVS
jgi:lipid-A-disaccharide synthase